MLEGILVALLLVLSHVAFAFIGMEVEERWPKLNDRVKAEIRHGVTAASADIHRELQELRRRLDALMEDREDDSA